MRFLLVGCNGRMGKAISRLVESYGDKIVGGIDIIQAENDYRTYINTIKVHEDYDSVIDFSTSPNHCDFINLALEKNVAYGLFSTQIDQTTKEFLKSASKQIPVLLCKNASIGVNILYEMLKAGTKNMPECDCIIQEYHHKEKQDQPSGTAKEIVNILQANNLSPETYSYRVGKIPGTHIIQFYLEDETITLSHTANSRDVFARGAIQAMHNLVKKENGIYYST